MITEKIRNISGVLSVFPTYIVALALLLAVPAAHAQEICFTCHAANAKAFSESLKGAKRLSCLSCHRDAKEHEKDPTTVAVKPVEFEKVCVDCHPKEEIATRVTKIKTNNTITHPVTVPTRHAAPASAPQGKGICGPTAMAALAALPVALYGLGRNRRR